ncbi:MAG: C4-type zinc ribbon domain-containing protein [Ignavibacteria bacterium]|nr:C4-type zinc ribbon domain-containing protein [Ignavibacteria bacterium]
MSEIKNKDYEEGMEGAEENQSEEEYSGSRILEFYEDGEDKKDKPDYSFELAILYKLKKIDEELADIEEEKGDLPEKIEDLTERINFYEKRIEENENNLELLKSEEKKLIKENKKIEERANKYDEQKYNVRTNKEYDDISKMIDECFEMLDKNEKRLKEIEGLKELLNKDIESDKEKLNEYIEERDECQSKLDDLNAQFEEEETELNKSRKAYLVKLDNETRSLYERINSSYKGEAIAIVRRGNCTGCYNSIPPQREIEIRMAESIFTCQSCGRILIDESHIKE